MIDPGINIDEIFGNVQLPCEAVRRLNNTLNAAELPDLPVERKKIVLDRDKLKGQHCLESPFERKGGGRYQGGDRGGRGGRLPKGPRIVVKFAH